MSHIAFHNRALYCLVLRLFNDAVSIVRLFIPVVFTVQLRVQNIQPKHNYLFLKEISYMFRLNCTAIIRRIIIFRTSTYIQFLGALTKLRKATISLVMVCLSVRMEQLGSHWRDFHGFFSIV
jgi:hypothetical protein